MSQNLEPFVSYSYSEIFTPAAAWKAQLEVEATGGAVDVATTSRFLAAVDLELVRNLPRRLIRTGILPPIPCPYPRRLSYPPELLPAFRTWARAWLTAVPVSHHRFRQQRDLLALDTITASKGASFNDTGAAMLPEATVVANGSTELVVGMVVGAAQSLGAASPRVAGRTEIFGNLDCDVDGLSHGGVTDGFRSGELTSSDQVIETQLDESHGQALRWHTMGGLVHAVHQHDRYGTLVGLPPGTAYEDSLLIPHCPYHPATLARPDNPPQIGLYQRGFRISVRARPHVPIHEFGHLFMRRLLQRVPAASEAGKVVSRETLLYRRFDAVAIAAEQPTLVVPTADVEGPFSSERQSLYRTGRFSVVRPTTVADLTDLDSEPLFSLLDLTLTALSLGFPDSLATALSAAQPSQPQRIALRDDQAHVLSQVASTFAEIAAAEFNEVFAASVDPALTDRSIKLLKGSSAVGSEGNFEFDGLWPFLASPQGNYALRHRTEYEAVAYESFSCERASFWDRVWMAHVINAVGVSIRRPLGDRILGAKYATKLSIDSPVRTGPDLQPDYRMGAGGTHALNRVGITPAPLAEFVYRCLVAAFGPSFSDPTTRIAHIPLRALRARARSDGAQYVGIAGQTKGRSRVVTGFLTRQTMVHNETEFDVPGAILATDLAFAREGQAVLLFVRENAQPVLARMSAGDAYFNEPAVRQFDFPASFGLGSVSMAAFLPTPAYTDFETTHDLIAFIDEDGGLQVGYDILAFGDPAISGSQGTSAILPAFRNTDGYGIVRRLSAATIVHDDPLRLTSQIPVSVDDILRPDGYLGKRSLVSAVSLLLLGIEDAPGSGSLRLLLAELPRADRLRQFVWLSLAGESLPEMPVASDLGLTLALADLGSEAVVGALRLAVGTPTTVMDTVSASLLTGTTAFPFAVAFDTPTGVSVVYGVYQLSEGVVGSLRRQSFPDSTLVDCAIGLHSLHVSVRTSGNRVDCLVYECQLTPQIRDGGLARSPWLFGSSEWMKSLSNVQNPKLAPVISRCEQEIELLDALCDGAAQPGVDQFQRRDRLWDADVAEDWLWVTHRLSSDRPTGQGFLVAAPTLRLRPQQGDSVTFLYGIGTASGVSFHSATEGGFRSRVETREGYFERGDPAADEETSPFSTSNHPRYEVKRTELPGWMVGVSLFEGDDP